MIQKTIKIVPVLLCLAIAGKSSAQTKKSTSVKKIMEKPGMIVAVQTDKATYKPTDPVKMSLTVKNNTKLPISMKYSSGQTYDLVLWRGTPEKGEQIWSWAMNKRFIQMIVTRKLEPGKSLVYSDTYTYSPMSPGPLKAGTYTVVGIVTTMGEKPRLTGKATFKVEGETTGTKPAPGGTKITVEEALAGVPKSDPKYKDFAKRLAEAEATLKEKPDDADAKKAFVEVAYEYGHDVMAGTNELTPAVKYRAALALYRRALKVDAAHQPSLDDLKSIEDVYTQMGRPIPQ